MKKVVSGLALAIASLAVLFSGGVLLQSPSGPTEQPAFMSTPTHSHELLYVRDGPGNGVDDERDYLSIIDTGTGTRERMLPIGVPTADWSLLYTRERTEAGKTIVRALDVHTGQSMRETTLDGNSRLIHLAQLTGMLGVAAMPIGLSHNGRWLALTSTWNKQLPTRQRLSVVDTAFAQPSRQALLNGFFAYHFEAISDDGTVLYLREYPNEKPPYCIRMYDLVQGALLPEPLADKTQCSTAALAAPGSSVGSLILWSPDGQWRYSSEVSGHGAYLHALNLAGRYTQCLDLPPAESNDLLKQELWSLVMTPDGQTLYAVNGALGRVLEIDTTRLQVRHTARLPVRSADSPTLLTRVARWLAPRAEAKSIVLGAAVLSRDGQTLFALDDQKGIIAINTHDLSLRARYPLGQTLFSLAISPDGTRLYTVAGDGTQANSILPLDAATGAVASKIESANRPLGVLRVEAKPCHDAERVVPC